MKKTKIIALFGESGTGKDTLLKLIKNLYPNNYNFILNCTTRPPRDNEINIVDYEFLSKEEFFKGVRKLTIKNITKFNGWFYGINTNSIKSDKINIGIFNPKSIYFFLTNTNYEIYPIKIEVKDKKRLERSLNREINPNCHEICRRFLADYEDYQNISFKYTIIDNNDNDINITCANLIKEINDLTKEN